MDTLLQDLRYSARLLRKKPGYSLVVILTLALGIGAVTSVFSVFNAALLKPYGPVNTTQWVYLWEHRTNSESLNQISVSMPNFRDWKQDSVSAFSDVVVWLPWSYTASGADVSNPERIRAAVISPEIFSATGVVPAAGRLLAPEDSSSGDRRVVLSYEFWKRAYGADASLPGKKITLNAATHTVVGIAPPGFSFPPEEQTDVWTVLPEAVLSTASRSQRSYRVAAKLRPGVTPKSAQSAMDVISARLARLYPEDKDYGSLVIPVRGCGRRLPRTRDRVVRSLGICIAFTLHQHQLSQARSFGSAQERDRLARGSGRWSDGVDPTIVLGNVAAVWYRRRNWDFAFAARRPAASFFCSGPGDSLVTRSNRWLCVARFDRVDAAGCCSNWTDPGVGSVPLRSCQKFGIGWSGNRRCRLERAVARGDHRSANRSGACAALWSWPADPQFCAFAGSSPRF
jgi:hypothetical protein